jgi:hypothetical protein
MILRLGLALLAVLLGMRAAWVIGGWMLRSFRFHSDFERVSFRIAAGLAVMAWLLLPIGLCGGIHRAAFWAVLAAVALSDVRRWRLPRRRWLRLAPLTLVVWPFLAKALRPPGPGDALLYHLPLAKAYALTHVVRPLGWIRFPVLPLFADLLSTMQYSMAAEMAPQLQSLAVLLVLLCAVYAWGARYCSPGVGALAVAALAGNPIVGSLGTSGYTDMALTLFFTLALLSARNWRTTEERGWLWAAGAFAGCAAACKYTGMLAGVWVAGTVLAARRPRALLPVGLAFFAVAAPFYGYIVFYTGNPVFPFFSNWFGYRYWNAYDLHEQLQQMHQMGAGHSLGAFLRIPWSLIFDQERYRWEADPSPFCLLALPVMLVAAWFERRIRVLLIPTAVFLPIWFSGAQFPRYLMLIAPTLNLAAAASLVWLAERAPPIGRILAKPWATAGACAILLLPSMWALRENVLYTFPTNYIDRYDYLSKTVPGFAVVARLNTVTNGRYNLYAFDAETALFAEGRTVGDWFGPARHVDFLPSFNRGDCAADANQLMLRRLQSLSIEYFLFPKRMLPPDYDRCRWFHLHFESWFEDPWFVLFRVIY